ncbi:hypothetical protein [Crateriforma conspicua]|uniref:Uncharacterized protein n=1 Tax=Crateriforma conspicua TaxID=2527996 RepID=A0A5C5Y8P5_9PLAN|nr:hypothetical protein [Crateriforma conspicua]TWT70645.1 hypothetical protein Pan14r_29520 [Crateriforma conspicua]
MLKSFAHKMASFAAVVAHAVTTVALIVVYMLVVCPIGLFRRIMGSDPLGRRDRNRPQWLPCSVDSRRQDYDAMY